MKTISSPKLIRNNGFLNGFLFLLFMNLNFFHGYAQQFDWVSQVGSPGYDFGYSVTADGEGNVYTAGDFSGEIIFSNGVRISSLGERDAYVSMHNSQGELLWVKTFSGTATTNATSVKALTSGKIIVCGSYWSDTDFEPLKESAIAANNGEADAYIACLDFRGNVEWIKTFGGTGNDHAYSVSIDHENNILVAGDFENELDFNPGKEIEIVASSGDYDSYIIKLNAAGEFIWVKTIGGVSRDIISAVSVDGAGNVYAGGFFSGTADFDPSDGSYLLFSAGSVDGFLLKLDADGFLNWSKQISGISFEFINSIATDKNGNTIATGCFTETVDFDPDIDSIVLSSEGFMDVFVIRINAGGNLEWAKRIGTKYNDYGASVAVDHNSNSYITGFYTGMVDFNPGDQTDMQQSLNMSADVFAVALDPEGNYLWSESFGGDDEDTGYSIYAGTEGEVVISGIFQEEAFFGSNNSLESIGQTDVFVLKLRSPDTSVGENNHDVPGGLKIYPNPAEKVLNVEFKNEQDETNILIIDINGKVVSEKKMHHASSLKIDIHELRSGTYFVKITNHGNEYTTSFVKK